MRVNVVAGDPKQGGEFGRVDKLAGEQKCSHFLGDESGEFVKLSLGHFRLRRARM